MGAGLRKQYYYNPFVSRHDKTIQDTEKRYAAKANCRVVTLTELQYIEDTSTLLIDGHCSRAQPGLMSDGQNGPRDAEILQVAAVVNQLNAKLPKTHIKIRLLGCYGALKMAPALAMFLGYNNFNQIAVGGYTESIFNNEDPKGRTLIDIGAKVIENTHDSPYVWWFDSQGKRTAKPDVISDPTAANAAFPER